MTHAADIVQECLGIVDSIIISYESHDTSRLQVHGHVLSVTFKKWMIVKGFRGHSVYCFIGNLWVLGHNALEVNVNGDITDNKSWFKVPFLYDSVFRRKWQYFVGCTTGNSE